MSSVVCSAAMCVIFIAWRVHARYRAVVLANRDEHRSRPTAALARWPGEPPILGGRDLREGGSWLAASRGGRFAAVTNFREVPPALGTLSRGKLVSELVSSDEPPSRFAERLEARSSQLAGVNLFAADADELWHWSNRGASQVLPQGLYGLSNGRLVDDWPKMKKGRDGLAAWVASGSSDTNDLFALLVDRTPADDAELPSTGVGLAIERVLSPIFIAAEEYGTRSSTVLLIGHDGRVHMQERRWGPLGAFEGEGEATLEPEL